MTQTNIFVYHLSGIGAKVASAPCLNIPVVKFLDFGLEGLRLAGVFGQHLHQVGDVAGGQAQSLDFGQLGVGRDVGDTLPQLRERRVDALRPPALLLRPGRPPLPHPRLEPLQTGVVRRSRRAELRRRVGRLELEVRRPLAVVDHPALEVGPVLVAALHEREGLVHQVVVVLVAPDQVHVEPGSRRDGGRGLSLLLLPVCAGVSASRTHSTPESSPGRTREPNRQRHIVLLSGAGREKREATSRTICDITACMGADPVREQRGDARPRLLQVTLGLDVATPAERGGERSNVNVFKG